MKIENCPFCGGTVSVGPLYGSSGIEYYIKCYNPSCSTHPETISFADKRDAINAWNTRKASKEKYVKLDDVISLLQAYDYRGLDIDTVCQITDEIIEKVKALKTRGE